MPVRPPAVVSLLVAASVAFTGCSTTGEDGQERVTDSTVATPPTVSTVPPSTAASTTTTTSTTSTTVSGALSANEVLDRVEPSMVLLTNAYGSGTGFAIADGYIVTSAHVVTPFDRVDVTPSGGKLIEDVPVVGIDLAADLAVIGPLADPLPALDLSGVDVETGEDVYLVGYPSETERSPTPTISRGIVSRLRTVEEFDQTYVQTDADISGGQSGGALLDSEANLVAISGLSLDEAFALALSADDIVDRLDHLLAGGDEWQRFPTSGETAGTVVVADLIDTVTMVTVPSATARELALSIDGPDDLILEVSVDSGGIYATQRSVEAVAEEFGLTVDEILAEAPDLNIIEVDDNGSYIVPVPADARAVITLQRASEDTPAEVSFISSIPVGVILDLDDPVILGVGDAVAASIEPLEYQDIYTIELVAGQSVTITAASPTGDMEFSVLAPGEKFGAETFYVDDSDLGLGGLDASGDFTAAIDGMHRIVVSDLTGQSGYRITVD